MSRKWKPLPTWLPGWNQAQTSEVSHKRARSAARRFRHNTKRSEQVKVVGATEYPRAEGLAKRLDWLLRYQPKNKVAIEALRRRINP